MTFDRSADTSYGDPANTKALQAGADPMIKLAYQDPAWLALQGLLSQDSSFANNSISASSSGARPAAAAAATATARPFDGNLRPSPFESPLAVSSIGSPNSSRDFGDSPLMRCDDEYILHGEGADGYAAMPLFNNDLVFNETSNAAGAKTPIDGQSSTTSWASDSAYFDFISVARAAYYDDNAGLANVNTQQGQAFNAAFQNGLSPVVSPQDVNPVGNDGIIGSGTGSAQAFAYAGGPNSFTAYLDAQSELMSTVRRLSLSESVSGYSSDQDAATATNSNGQSLANSVLSLPAVTTAADVNTPLPSSSEASPDGASAGVASSQDFPSEDVSQLVGRFVREYARNRDGGDASDLVRILSAAGVEFDTSVLGGISTGLTAAAVEPTVTPSPINAPYGQLPAEFAFPATPTATTEAHHDDHHAPSMERKVRSSVQCTVKKEALATPSRAVSYWQDGKRIFQCDVCQKTFDRAFNLKTHRTIHSDHREYPFTCPFAMCGKAFSRKADCNRHTKTVHLKKGEILPHGQKNLAVVDLG